MIKLSDEKFKEFQEGYEKKYTDVQQEIDVLKKEFNSAATTGDKLLVTEKIHRLNTQLKNDLFEDLRRIVQHTINDNPEEFSDLDNLNKELGSLSLAKLKPTTTPSTPQPGAKRAGPPPPPKKPGGKTPPPPKGKPGSPPAPPKKQGSTDNNQAEAIYIQMPGFTKLQSTSIANLLGKDANSILKTYEKATKALFALQYKLITSDLDNEAKEKKAAELSLQADILKALSTEKDKQPNFINHANAMLAMQDIHSSMGTTILNDSMKQHYQQFIENILMTPSIQDTITKISNKLSAARNLNNQQKSTQAMIDKCQELFATSFPITTHYELTPFAISYLTATDTELTKQAKDELTRTIKECLVTKNSILSANPDELTIEQKEQFAKLVASLADNVSLSENNSAIISAKIRKHNIFGSLKGQTAENITDNYKKEINKLLSSIQEKLVPLKSLKRNLVSATSRNDNDTIQKLQTEINTEKDSIAEMQKQLDYMKQELKKLTVDAMFICSLHSAKQLGTTTLNSVITDTKKSLGGTAKNTNPEKEKSFYEKVSDNFIGLATGDKKDLRKSFDNNFASMFTCEEIDNIVEYMKQTINNLSEDDKQLIDNYHSATYTSQDKLLALCDLLGREIISKTTNIPQSEKKEFVKTLERKAFKSFSDESEEELINIARSCSIIAESDISKDFEKTVAIITTAINQYEIDDNKQSQMQDIIDQYQRSKILLIDSTGKVILNKDKAHGLSVTAVKDAIDLCIIEESKIKLFIKQLQNIQPNDTLLNHLSVPELHNLMLFLQHVTPDFNHINPNEAVSTIADSSEENHIIDALISYMQQFTANNLYEDIFKSVASKKYSGLSAALQAISPLQNLEKAIGRELISLDANTQNSLLAGDIDASNLSPQSDNQQSFTTRGTSINNMPASQAIAKGVATVDAVNQKLAEEKEQRQHEEQKQREEEQKRKKDEEEKRRNEQQATSSSTAARGIDLVNTAQSMTTAFTAENDLIKTIISQIELGHASQSSNISQQLLDGRDRINDLITQFKTKAQSIDNMASLGDLLKDADVISTKVSSLKDQLKEQYPKLSSAAISAHNAQQELNNAQRNMNSANTNLNAAAAQDIDNLKQKTEKLQKDIDEEQKKRIEVEEKLAEAEQRAKEAEEKLSQSQSTTGTAEQQRAMLLLQYQKELKDNMFDLAFQHWKKYNNNPNANKMNFAQEVKKQCNQGLLNKWVK